MVKREMRKRGKEIAVIAVIAVIGSAGVSQVPQASAMLRRSRFLGPTSAESKLLEGGASELGLVRE